MRKKRTSGRPSGRCGAVVLSQLCYAEAMIRGDRFPPIDVFQDNGDLVLADGFHRVRAARKARFERIDAVVHHGTRTDALKFSLQANHSHGLRRSNADKQYAVTLALTEFSRLSDRMIAALCGVSHSTVGIVRRQLVDSTSCGTRTEKTERCAVCL